VDEVADPRNRTVLLARNRKRLGVVLAVDTLMECNHYSTLCIFDACVGHFFRSCAFALKATCKHFDRRPDRRFVLSQIASDEITLATAALT
jgi:hypothetical protein